ncbi:MAG: peptidylprolyl isomerase [Vicinamibacteria bacterium]|nr:peptidylprolyl isomerase [Vicinamibacteria bacterium]
MPRHAAHALALALAALPLAAQSPQPTPPTTAGVLAATTAADWRPLDAENTLVMDVAGGSVVIELSAAFAPGHAANVRALVREGFFDGLTVNRVQDNYVVQWGDGEEDEAKSRVPKVGKAALPAEFDRPAAGLPFTPNPDGDVYAPEAGWSGGFPAARDPKTGRAWMIHCYGVLGAGRGNTADSGGGAQLFVVTGHSPRHLDRNITAFGRVMKGIEHLTSLPRGTGPLGFYEKAEQRVPIRRVRMVADLPEAERPKLEVLRTDTDSFRALIEARRHRHEEWFLDPVGKVEVCNVPLPVREAKPAR